MITNKVNDKAENTFDSARKAVSMAAFLLQHRDALRALLHANLFKPVPGSTAWRGKEWRNVAEHCIVVARALDALGGLLGMSNDERDSMVKVGLVHDWNKRLTKNADAFSDEERVKAETTAKDIVAKHDPCGLLLAATEPEGLPRLESGDASLTEHCLHFVDLNCTSEGIVGPEERFRDIERRGKTADEGGQTNMWERKKALVAKEEEMLLHAIRTRGVHVPEGMRVHELLQVRLAKA